MSNVSNAVQSIAVSVDVSLTLPASVSRAESARIARDLRGDESNALSGVSSTAARMAFVSRCLGITISAAVHGDTSSVDKIFRLARALPEYKVDKSGKVKGKLGALLSAYAQAGTIGRMLKDQAVDGDNVDLLTIINSPVFGALVALPAKASKADADASSKADADASSKADADASSKADADWYTMRERARDSAIAMRERARLIEVGKRAEKDEDERARKAADAARMAYAASVPDSIRRMMSELDADIRMSLLSEFAALEGLKLAKAKVKANG